MLKILCKATLLFLAVTMVVPPVHACNQPPGYGFIIVPQFEDLTTPMPSFHNIVHQFVEGGFASADSNTQGDRSGFAGFTDGGGKLTELGKASPATWLLQFPDGACGGSAKTVHLAASSSAQTVTCATSLPADSISASPNSFDTSTGNSDFSVTMTDTSEAWPITPVTVTVIDAYGNGGSWAFVSVIDSWNCSGDVQIGYTGTNQYLWLSDGNGNGIGYASISVTNGTGGGG